MVVFGLLNDRRVTGDQDSRRLRLVRATLGTVGGEDRGGRPPESTGGQRGTACDRPCRVAPRSDTRELPPGGFGRTDGAGLQRAAQRPGRVGLSIACLAAADYACVVVQPGGFEARTLIHLHETVRMLNERVNPRLSVIGAVLTNCHPRRAITEEVHGEVSRHWPVLGHVRADARLLYATTSGKVNHLTRSNALQDYAVVVQRLMEMLPWLRRR
jgi:hypothetical protein